MGIRRFEVVRLTGECPCSPCDLVPPARTYTRCHAVLAPRSYWGELTDLGRESTLALGTRLRSLYVDQLHFLPSKLPDLPVEENVVEFRSTGMPRTIESLHQIVQGLFPERDGAVQYTVRNPQDER